LHRLGKRLGVGRLSKYERLTDQIHSSQILNVQVPFLFKEAVDLLNVPAATTAGSILMTGAGAVLIGCKEPSCAFVGGANRTMAQKLTSTLSAHSQDGAARIGSALFNEFRNAVFASVAQRAIRLVSKGVFLHLLKLDSRFHLDRETGALSRAIDRGTKYGLKILLARGPMRARGKEGEWTASQLK
jgi:ABC transporter ATM